MTRISTLQLLRFGLWALAAVATNTLPTELARAQSATAPNSGASGQVASATTSKPGSETDVLQEGWRSEYERPIYFIETREEFICAWCKLSNGHLITQPHSLSPATPRVFRHPREAEVIGRVVGIAMRLHDWERENSHNGKKAARLH